MAGIRKKQSGFSVVRIGPQVFRESDLKRGYYFSVEKGSMIVLLLGRSFFSDEIRTIAKESLAEIPDLPEESEVISSIRAAPGNAPGVCA